MAKSPYPRKVKETLQPALSEDGVLSTVKVDGYIHVEGETRFTMWMSQTSSLMKSITKLAEFKVLWWIGNNMDFDKGAINLTSAQRKQMATDLRLSASSIDHTISDLRNIKVIKPLFPELKLAVYKVNPMFLWKGCSTERVKAEGKWLEEERIEKLPEAERQKLKNVARAAKALYDFSTIESAA